jgi:hypothetical protein
VTTTTVELTSVLFLFSSFFLEINAMFSVDPKEGGWGVPEYDARLERKNGNNNSSSSSGVGSKMYKRKVLWLTRRIKQRCVLRLLHHWLRRKSQQQQQQEQQVCLVIGCCCFLLFPTHPFPLLQMLSFLKSLSSISLTLTPSSTLRCNTAGSNIRIEYCQVLALLLTHVELPTTEERWSWFELCMDWQDCYATTNSSHGSHGSHGASGGSNKLDDGCRELMCVLLKGERFALPGRNEFVWSWIDALFQSGKYSGSTDECYMWC